MKNGTGHQNNFALIRHVAAFFVVFDHLVYPLHLNNWVYNISHGKIILAEFGVNAFFALSGFLVTQSLLQSFNRKVFLLKRILRIYPALIFATFCITFIIGFFYSSIAYRDYLALPSTWHFFIRNAVLPAYHFLPTVFENDSPNPSFWTLLYEIIAYAVLFAIGKKLAGTTKTILVLWLLLTVINCSPLALHIPYYNSVLHIFFSGAVYFLYRSSIITSAAVKRVVLFTAILAWLLLMLFSGNQYPLLFNTLSNMALVVFIIELGLSKPLIKWPGWDISYGTYLWGYAVSGCFLYQHKIVFTHPLLEAWLIIACTFAVAFLSWFAVEKPFLNKKNNLH